jgi:hypothetical protein
MVWYIVGFIVVAFLILRLFTFLFGNFRATLNRVITQYVAVKQMEPTLNEKELFFEVLNRRYPETSGMMAEMNKRKNEIKKEIDAEIESGMSVLDKYNLPILIYICLVIEQNSYINQKKNVEELLKPLTQEVKRQGFGKYI